MSNDGATMYYVYRHNPQSGEIHRWATDGDAVLSAEECNRDAIVVEDDMDESEALHLVAEQPERACGHCWPQGEAEEEPDSPDGPGGA